MLQTKTSQFYETLEKNNKEICPILKEFHSWLNLFQIMKYPWNKITISLAKFTLTRHWHWAMSMDRTDKLSTSTNGFISVEVRVFILRWTKVTPPPLLQRFVMTYSNQHCFWSSPECLPQTPPPPLWCCYLVLVEKCTGSSDRILDPRNYLQSFSFKILQVTFLKGK